MILFTELLANVQHFASETFIKAMQVTQWNEKDDNVLQNTLPLVGVMVSKLD